MNRKSISLLAFLLFAAVMLAGCQENVPTTSNIGSPSENTSSNMPAGVAQPVVHSETDLAAYNSAQDLKDPSYCDKISDTVFKTECKVVLEDTKALDEAVQKMDATLCSKLSNTDQKGACEIKVAAQIQETQQRQQNEAALVKNNDLNNEIVQKGDLARCKELDQLYIESCELNILVNKANFKQNISICDQASSPSTVDKCKKAYTPIEQEI